MPIWCRCTPTPTGTLIFNGLYALLAFFALIGLVASYYRLRATGEAWAFFATLTAAVASVGTIANGLYQLANLRYLAALATTNPPDALVTTLYQRLRETEATFALWAALLGVLAALGSAAHGGYDLGNAINPPTLTGDFQTNLNTLPSQIDPRGLLTFGVTGIAFLVIAWLIVKGGRLPRNLGYLGYALGVLLVIVYLGRLILLQPSNLFLLGAAGLTGFLLAPIWYIWLGLLLWRSQPEPQA